MVPSSIQERFFELLLTGVTYEERDGVFYTACTTQMDDVEIMVEGCDSFPYKDGEDGPQVNCDQGYERNKKYYMVVFAG